MLETFFAGVTAVATMYTALDHFFAKRPRLTVEGVAYHHQAGTDFAQIRVTISAKSPTHVRAVECKDCRIAAGINDERVRRLPYGARFGTKDHRETLTSFFISPPPKDGKPVVLKFDTGLRLFPQTIELWPSDFTAAARLDDKWPTHPAASASAKAS